MPDALPEDELVVYSDYVCPFCYLGKHSLEEYLQTAEDPPEVTWKPFDLRWHKRRPDGSLDDAVPDGKDEAYFERAKRNVERLADEYGVEMTVDIAKDIDAWNAQKASLYVRQEQGEDAFEAFHDAVFEALWRHANDIGDPEVLAEIAASTGLDPHAIREAATSDRFDEDIRAAFEESHRAGITGVPTFVYNDLRLPGAVPPERIGTLVDQG